MHAKGISMHPTKFARLRFRIRPIAPIDALIGLAVLAGAALTIVPMMAMLTAFALIAAMTGSTAKRHRPVPLRAG